MELLAHISAREGAAFCRVAYTVTRSNNLPVTSAMDFGLPRPYFSKVELDDAANKKRESWRLKSRDGISGV